MKDIMLKKYLPFITIGFFTVVANLLLVFGVYKIRDINASTLATINFGIYVMSLFAVLMESISKYLTIKLSRKNTEEFKGILYSNYIKLTPLMMLIISFVAAVFILVYPEHLILLITIYVIALILYVYYFFRSWINALEKYWLLGLFTLAFPITRVISGYLVSNGLSYLTMFWGFTIASAIILIVSILYLKSKNKGLLSAPVDYPKDTVTKDILISVSLQLAVNTFWILDGIVLNKSLSANLYTTYTTFAFIYKFPFFIVSSFLFVILGENISSDIEQKQFFKTILRGVLLVLIIFLPVILFEYFNTGYIHNLIGYGKYYIDGISLFFGIAWLLQSLIFILYTSLLKLAPKNIIVMLEIVISAITFVVGLIVFNSTLNTLTLFMLIHGLIFFLLSSLLLIGLVQKSKR